GAACVGAGESEGGGRARAASVSGPPMEGSASRVSHNHGAPGLSRGSTIGGLPDIPACERYAAMLGDQLAGAVYAAQKRLEPARIGSATVSAPGLSGNRVRHERPVDDSVTVIRIDRDNGDPLPAGVSLAGPPRAGRRPRR